MRIFKEDFHNFDPLGYILSCLIRGKILLQQMWMCTLGWDEEVSKELSIVAF